MNTTYLAAFTDTVDGMQSQVHLLDDGRYSVGLVDLDSGMNVGVFIIFLPGRLADAIAHAKVIVAKVAA